jgi:DNA-binding CsgD family transcriptional regulator
MRLAVFSKERLFLDAISGLLGRNMALRIVARETNISSFVNSAKSASAQVLVVDTEKLDFEEVQFFLGARAGGEFLLAAIGEVFDGADTTISRSSSADELFESLSALAPLIRVDERSSEARRSYGNANNLTKREFEVAQFIAKGMSNRAIAETADLHEQSVKNLVSVVLRKLSCENRTQVALKLLNPDLEPVLG